MTLSYISFYERRRYECHAPSLYDAKLKAIDALRVPKSKQHLVTTMLAEKDGVPYSHSTASL